ncbi:MAG: hypothetical protein I8H75_00455 [Myxococcaceae bacterium]|nr:hypothetical protein [Myxococcaceae bacterium]MBH2005816.1 hypothetical protein [Myxococcaceae bacterium]
MIRIILLVLIGLAAGYFLFSDQNRVWDLLKRRVLDLDMPEIRAPSQLLQDMSPSQSPDYSDQDRDRLDSILRDHSLQSP